MSPDLWVTMFSILNVPLLRLLYSTGEPTQPRVSCVWTLVICLAHFHKCPLIFTCCIGYTLTDWTTIGILLSIVEWTLFHRCDYVTFRATNISVLLQPSVLHTHLYFVLSIVPPSASCCLSWIRFKSVLWLFCYPPWLFTLSHITFESFPFVNALFLSIVPPSASCCLSWIQFKSVLWILCSPPWLHIVAYHIWFLSLCECSTLTINCSTIGILFIVDSIQWCPVDILLPIVTLLIIAFHIWFLWVPFPLWMLYSFQLFHHRHLVAYRGFNSLVFRGCRAIMRSR